jgi:N-methylhydantoinase A
MNLRVGIDVGGTFTDGIVLDGVTLRTAKVPTQPDDPARGILECLDALGVVGSDVSLFVHGSTIATNAIIEKKAAPTAHITTAGFRDVLYIRRGDSVPYQLDWTPPLPVVRRRDIFEVDERIDAHGQVLTPLDVNGLRRVARIIAERHYPAVSVTLMNSYINAAHERRVKEILEEECPDTLVCISAEVLPHYREFERSSTTAANAYLLPLISKYLAGLATRLEERGYRDEALVMQSNGGLATHEEAARLPGKLIRSGPAGGAIPAAQLAEVCDLESAVLLDIGGTSTEVALLRDGRPGWTAELEFTWGVPIRFPAIDIESVGAGGGSVGWVESGRFLKVGPHSAGAVPGPACYARGGEQPTTTDAQLVLGRLNESALLDGGMPIDRELAKNALTQVLGVQLDAGPREVASGMLHVATNNIVQAIRRITVNRGIDPRDAGLIAYGGNGPLYAADVADILGIDKVVIPVSPGVTSALGMVLADHEYDESRTLLMREGGIDFDEVERCFAAFEHSLEGRLVRAHIPAEQRSLERYLDVRYDGQGYEIPVALPRREYEDLTVRIPDEPFTEATLVTIKDRFHSAHQREFGWSDPTWPVELVFARVVARGAIEPKPRVESIVPATCVSEFAPTRRRVVFPIQGVERDVEVLHRSQLAVGTTILGPAVIQQMDATTLVPPGWTAVVDKMQNLILQPDPSNQSAERVRGTDR